MDITLNTLDASCSSVVRSTGHNIPKVDCGKNIGQKTSSCSVGDLKVVMDLTQDDDASVQDTVPSTSPGPSGVTASGINKMKRKSVGRSSKDNTKKKAHTALDKEAEKQRLAEEKAAKRSAAETNKIYKPGECMKHMNIEVHPNLLSAWYMSDVGRELAAAGARLVRDADLCQPDLVLWSRSVPATLTADLGQLKLSSSRESCDRGLYILLAETVAEHVAARTLAEHVGFIKDMSATTLTLVVFGVKEYMKTFSRKTSNSNRNSMTNIELEMALTDLLVSKECDAVLVNTPNELALLIIHFTKALAEAPFKKAKRACDEQADFYMRGDSRKCVAIDKDGIGVSRLWQQMIAILPMSSLETSRALCAKYKSPLVLCEALQCSDSEKELADIGVARAAVPGSKARRLGPEFARKLKTLFTAEDGNILLD